MRRKLVMSDTGYARLHGVEPVERGMYLKQNDATLLPIYRIQEPDSPYPVEIAIGPVCLDFN